MKSLKLIIILCLICFKVIASSNDYPFKVEIKGVGTQSIIFIPGFASSGDVWNETVSKYEKNFRCHILTMPGFADAEPKENCTFQSWSNEIAKYITEEKLTKPIIIGHSMGGGLAMNIAADHSDLISKIIVVDALPCLAAMQNPNFESKSELDCSIQVQQMLALSEEQFLAMQKMSIPSLVANESMQEKIVEWSVASDRKTLGAMFCSFYNIDLRAKIKNISCPSLILLEAPFVNFKDTIEGQFKNLASAELRFADKGLHFIMYDDKDWYFNQLHNFIITK